MYIYDFHISMRLLSMKLVEVWFFHFAVFQLLPRSFSHSFTSYKLQFQFHFPLKWNEFDKIMDLSIEVLLIHWIANYFRCRKHVDLIIL